MDDRKGKSSILWSLLPPYLSRDDRDREDELRRFRHNLLRYFKDNDLRNLRDNDLRNLRDNIFRCLRNYDLPYWDDELRNLIAYEIANEQSRLKKADDMNSALLSAKKKAGRDKRHVVIPPGSKLLTIAEFFYSKKTYTLCFKPIVDDMRQEYFEALCEKRVWKARWMYGLYVWKFFCAMGLNWGFSLLEKILKTWRASS
jgi:hypothetical protein